MNGKRLTPLFVVLFILVANLIGIGAALTMGSSKSALPTIIIAVSTLLLAILAGLGLEQIFVTKAKNEEETHRSRIAESVRQAEVFRRLLREYEGLVDQAGRASPSFYDGPTEINDINRKGEPLYWSIWDTDFLNERRWGKSMRHFDDAQRFLNLVESFALGVFHMSDRGLLDEDALFKATGATFLEIVNDFYDVLCITRARDGYMLYSHISDLYVRWEGRLVDAHHEHLSKVDYGGWNTLLGQLQVLRVTPQGRLGSARGLIARSESLDDSEEVTVYIRVLNPSQKPIPAWPVSISFIGVPSSELVVKGYLADEIEVMTLTSGQDAKLLTNAGGTITLYYAPGSVTPPTDVADHDAITISIPDKLNEPAQYITRTLCYRYRRKIQ